MKYHVILAAVLCSAAGVVSAASFCNGATQVTESQACTINADTDAEGMLIIAGLTNVRNGAMPELLTYLQTLRDLDDTPARARSRTNTTLTGLMEVRPVQFFDNLVVLVVSTALLRSGDENLSVSLSDYEKELNKILAGLTENTVPQGLEEFRVNIKKITTAQLEVSQRLNFNSADPNDLRFDEQWSLHEKGIKAETAWTRLAIIPDSELPSVTVAVIDEQLNSHHPELKDTGMQDGCDLTIQTQQPFECPPVQSDSSGHGTSVAGVIAAATNNIDGVAGATYRGLGRGNIAKILPVQMDFSTQCTSALLSALRFAVDPEHETKNKVGLWNLTGNGPSGGTKYRPAKGAKVINMSFSFDGCSEATGMLIDRIAHHFPDVLLVNAVKNDYRDLDKEDEVVREYPASYKKPTNAAFDNLLTVTYSDLDRSIQGNYGNISVDIAAPGTNDLPFLASDRPGSSFAAPLVSSTAAVLMSLAPDWGFAKIREYIMKSRNTDFEHAWNEEWSNGGLLDMDAATKPPVRFKASAPGAITAGTVWTVGTSRRINWARTFNPKVGTISLCNKMKLEAQYQDDAGNWPMDWQSLVTGTVDTGDAAGGGKTVMVPSWNLESDERRSARVRLRCKETQLFTVSDTFTVKKN